MWTALRRLIAANPMGLFLWAIISKWYVMVAVTSFIVLYYVAQGLVQIGFIQFVTDTIENVFDTTKAIAQHCTIKLGKANWEGLVDFWECMKDPPAYEVGPGTGEIELEQGLNRLIRQEGGTVPEIPQPVVVVDPYAPPPEPAPPAPAPHGAPSPYDHAAP